MDRGLRNKNIKNQKTVVFAASMNLYVIFELPSTAAGDDCDTLTTDGLKVYLYDEGSEKDSISIMWFGGDFDEGGNRWQQGVSTGNRWSIFWAVRFDNQQYDPQVFIDHVMPTINGDTTQWDAAAHLLNYADAVKEFAAPNVYFNMHDWLYGTSMQGNPESECSAFGAAVTSLLRSAEIPARLVIIDEDESDGGWNFDTSTEAWLDGKWYVMQGYSSQMGIQTRSWWGTNYYTYGGDIGELIVTAGPGFTAAELGTASGMGKTDYAYCPDINPNEILKVGWVITECVPYWAWRSEPTDVGNP